MRVKQAKEVWVANFSSGTVIFDLKSYRSFVLNDAAHLIWNFCKKPKDLNQISGFLNRRYQINLSQARKDSQALIDQLKERNLLVA